MKKTKIICTVGPASNNLATLKKMAHAGMNVVRINMSHCNHTFAQGIVDNVVKLRQQLSKPIAIMVDTKGPEIRIKTFKNNCVELVKGQTFTLTTREVEGDNTQVSLAYKNLPNQVAPNQKIYLNNAMVVLKIKTVTPTDIVCKVIFGGVVSSNKSLIIPNVVPIGNFLSQADKQDLLFAIKNKANFIAASFVSTPENVLEMRKFLDANGGNQIGIIAKIENHDGVKNLKKIVQVADGVIVARGDLGVEIALEKLPAIQKQAIFMCNQHGKIGIVATEMLESMTHSIRPTRAEVSDVANAVYQLASATMLSGETAVGVDPARSTSVMNKIGIEIEKHIDYNQQFSTTTHPNSCVTDAVSKSSCTNAITLGAKAIVVFTHSGESARLLAKYRTSIPIIAVTPYEHVYHSLALVWGVTPFCVQESELDSQSKFHEIAKILAKKFHFAKTGDLIIIQHGKPNVKGSTDTLKVIYCD
jgi:pyruvate kinase